MQTLFDSLLVAMLAIFLGCCTPHAHATPEPEITFIEDTGTGEDVVQARLLVDEQGDALRTVLMSIEGYARLHPWIASVSSADAGLAPDEFRIEFRFPWPVGKRWSRIRVTQSKAGGISWHQVAGNMKANRGQLHFTRHTDHMEVHYSAVVSVGLPTIVMRTMKKHFLADFIQTACELSGQEQADHLLLAGN